MPMRIVDNNNAVDIRSMVSAEEWAIRCDLAACYRLVSLHRWDDLIFTHISARVPGTHDFLINPYGYTFDEITASSLVKVDLHGNKLLPTAYDINPAGFTIHSAVHEAREDAMCVLHLHTMAGVAVSAQRGGLLPISQQSTLIMASLSYHDYEGLALNQDEKARLQADLGKTRNMILRNHGLLTVGSSISDAFLAMYTLQRACEIQIAAQGHGAELIMVGQSVLDTVPAYSKAVTLNVGSALAWPALLRKLDRANPGYKD